MSDTLLGGRSITDEIEELRRKITLLDGDRKAYYENSQWTMQQNKEIVQKLRTKNKEMRLELAKKKAGDEKVIDDAFAVQDPIRHCAMRGMSGKEAIAKLDQQVCEMKKHLNALNHQQKMRTKKLDTLQTEYGQTTKDGESTVLNSVGQSEEAQQLRILENRLDKMNLKLNEASKIHSTYVQILEHQKEERRSWPKQLDALEQEIKQQAEEMADLHGMLNDAQIARDTARTELSKLEESVQQSKRSRETQLASYKKIAEEKKEHAEKVEKRMLHRTSIQQDDAQHGQQAMLSGEDQERKITSYEDAMAQIKEATGVTDIHEVVQRFSSQGETQKHLEALKVANEKSLIRLKEDKAKLQKEFEELKYSGEAKLSSGQKILEEYEDKLKESQRKAKEAKVQEKSLICSLVDLKSGVEHLADKLQFLKAPRVHGIKPQVPVTGDEYVLTILDTCEQKLMKLMEDLSGKDIQDVIKEMDDSEFRSGMEAKLPDHNTRVKLPTILGDGMVGGFEEEDDSDDEEDEIMSRNAIKKNSQQIVDSKTKKHKTRAKRKSKK